MTGTSYYLHRRIVEVDGRDIEYEWPVYVTFLSIYLSNIEFRVHMNVFFLLFCVEILLANDGCRCRGQIRVRLS